MMSLNFMLFYKDLNLKHLMKYDKSRISYYIESEKSQ